MSDRSTTERPAEAAGRRAGMLKDDLILLVGIGAIVVGGSCSTNARIGDLRDEVETLRADVRTEIHNLRVEVGAEIRNLRAEVGAEIRHLRTEVGAEIGDVRARVENLEDSTAASFAAVRGQLGAVAVCVLEIRNLVGGGRQDDGRSTTCDDALSAILAPSPPSPPAGR